MLSINRIFLAIIIMSLFVSVNADAQEYKIGVFYFPGWVKRPGTNWDPPWDQIKLYPDREPLLGWYPEGEVWVAEKQIQWLYDYGVNFLIFDWYWTKDNKPGLEHALQAYLKAKNSNLVKYTILWANHSDVPESLDQFTAMVDFWINNYFNKKQFMTIDGKPVVYIFSAEILRDNAKKFGASTNDLLNISRNIAIKAGYKGIYFVACTQAIYSLVNEYIPSSGYDAISAYNYHRGYSGTYEKGGLSINFAELASGYKQSWEWILENSSLPYFLPVSAGWSKNPWGSHTPHDASFSDPLSFRKHLVEAKSMLDRYPDKTKNTIVICAWNEFGEGSYIEPTKKWKFQYLNAIKDVFRK